MVEEVLNMINPISSEFFGPQPSIVADEGSGSNCSGGIKKKVKVSQFALVGVKVVLQKLIKHKCKIQYEKLKYLDKYLTYGKLSKA